MTASENVIAITSFLQEIQIPFQFSTLKETTFLPGILIDQGKLIIDRKRLKYPGDLLHEAGHIAVTTKTDRATLSGDVHKCGHGPAEEMAAIAWSWAACMKTGLPAEVVFHPDGYRGGSTNYIETFTTADGFGHPLLTYWGMCRPCSSPHGFPQMTNWLRA